MILKAKTVALQNQANFSKHVGKPKPPQNSKMHQNAVKRISKACLHLPITKVLKSRHGLNLTHWRLCFEVFVYLINDVYVFWVAVNLFLIHQLQYLQFYITHTITHKLILYRRLPALPNRYKKAAKLNVLAALLVCYGMYL